MLDAGKFKLKCHGYLEKNLVYKRYEDDMSIYNINKISSRFSRVNIIVLMVKKLLQTSTSIYKKLNGQYYLICIEMIYVARSF